MANEESDSSSDAQKQSKNKDYDPTLDFFNELFDPLKALRTPGITPPVINATTHDNLSKYKRVHMNVDNVQQVSSKAGTSKRVENTEKVERKWLPHQLPIKVERTCQRNIFTRMETMTGPLSLLKKCKDEHIRIKVWTRHSHDIRGYCIAFVTLFDKHWNLVLEDVTEVWTRRKRRKVLPTGLDNKQSIVLQKHLVPPAITVIKNDEKTETCQRYVDQLLLRGEQVALVAIVPSSD